MESQEWGVGQAFRELADVLETLETSDTSLDITSATPVQENLLTDGSVSVELGVLVPFFERDTDGTGAEFTTRDVRIDDDGNLRLKLEATVPHRSEQDVSADTDPVHRESTRTPRETNEDDSGGANPRSEPDGMTEAGTADSEDDEPVTETADESGKKNVSIEETEKNEITESSESETGDEEETPPYKDRERLLTVYEECETFSEMTDELDVDVTPQTVRRYMIEYGIHEPASTTGSRSAEILLNTDPDSFSVGNDSEDNEGDNARGNSKSSRRARNTELDSVTLDESGGSITTTDVAGR